MGAVLASTSAVTTPQVYAHPYAYGYGYAHHVPLTYTHPVTYSVPHALTYAHHYPYTSVTDISLTSSNLQKRKKGKNVRPMVRPRLILKLGTDTIMVMVVMVDTGTMADTTDVLIMDTDTTTANK